MKKYLPIIILCQLVLASQVQAQFEKAKDSVVQLYGVIMTADSLVGIPAVSVTIKGQNRGTITNFNGVFSIVVLKGDQVEFSHVSYKPKSIIIPKNLEGNQHSVIQLLIADTVYLPVTIIKPLPTPEQFARDFINTKVDDDAYEIARKNTSSEKMRALQVSTPGDGREVTNMQFRNIANKAVYYGQAPPMNIFNPAAWASFIQAWKRGDFKKNK